MTETFTDAMKEWQEYLKTHPKVAKYFEDYMNSYAKKAEQSRLYTDEQSEREAAYTFKFLGDE